MWGKYRKENKDKWEKFKKKMQQVRQEFELYFGHGLIICCVLDRYR